MKKTLTILVYLFLFAFNGECQTEIIRNGDFSQANTNWSTTGEFHYNACLQQPCNSGNPYAYTAASGCTNIDNASGSLYQQSLTIPANATGGILSFVHKTGTTRTSSSFDYLDVSIEYDGNVYNVLTLTNRDASPSACTPVSIDISSYIINRRSKKLTLRFTAAEQTDGEKTIFRIDNVSILVNTSGTSGSCVTWLNGTPDQETIDAANFLCPSGAIPTQVEWTYLNSTISLNEVCGTLTRMLYPNLNQTILPSDFNPVLQADIYNLSWEDQRCAKAMLFLDYQDGISPLTNDYYNLQFTQDCQSQEALRVILEAFNVSPDWGGFSKFSESISSFYCNIKKSDKNYGYIKEAKDRGWLDKFYSNFSCSCGPCLQETMSRQEFWKLLYRIKTDIGVPVPTADDFFKPNNFSIYNSDAGGDIDRGIYNTGQSFFSIPTYGLPINFAISYHSNFVDYPLLTNKKEFFQNPNLDNLLLQRVAPLGRCWTHSYHVVISASLDENGKDQFFYVQWPNGAVHVFDYKKDKYQTKGVYDNLAVTVIDQSGYAKKITIITKDGIKYYFERNKNNLFSLVQIKDRNANSVQLEYEDGPTTASGISAPDRLSKVYVPNTKAALTFSYQPGTNFLSSVTDNIGRKISFDVDKVSETLQYSKDAENHRTDYTYGQLATEQYLLKKIYLPKGNTVTNEYQERKLRQSSNNQYVISATFQPSYSLNDATTATSVTVSADGQSYVTNYSQDVNGKTFRVTSRTEDKEVKYADTHNPTLPTKITDNILNTVQSFTYDNSGNILKSTNTRGSVVQVDEYQYDDFNNITWHKWPNGTEINYTYNASGNLIKEAGPLGYEKNYAVNAYGQVEEVSNHGLTTRFDYNGKNGVLSKIYVPLTSIVSPSSATYNDASQLQEITNPNSSVDKFSYYPSGKIKQVIKDAGGLNLTTQYAYDDNGNVTSVVDPRGNATTLDYDFDTDDLIDERFGTNIKNWIYNENGTIRSFIDKNGYKSSYTYYPKNNAAEGLLKSDGYAQYTYDNTTKQITLAKKTSDNSNLQYYYDNINRLSQVKYSPHGAWSTVTYNYNDNNDKIKEEIVHGKSIKYLYDELNRIKQVSWKSGATDKIIETLEYRSDGLLSSEHLGNGISIYYNYDAAGRLDSIWSKVDATNVLLHTVGCSFDKWGNRIRESSYVNTSLKLYSYGPLNYPKDLVYDSENRIQTIDNLSPNHDNNGNTLENQNTSFSQAGYDNRDNLISCKSYGDDLKYTYDALENRRSKNGKPYILDLLNNSNVLFASNTKQYYIHSPLGLVCSVDSVSGKINYYLYDFRGSSLAIVDENKTITESYHYDPFGNIDSATVTPGSTTPFLFVGKQGIMYETAGLYYMRARYYDPQLGRFISEDPEWSTNLYPYGGNNPLTKIDPNGMSIVGVESFIPIWGFGKATIQSIKAGDPLAAGINSTGFFLDLFTIGEFTAERLALRASLGVDIQGAVWAQKTFSTTFSSEGKFVGKTIDDVAASLKNGSLPVSEVPINVIVRNGQTYILNTRSSIALLQAGIPRGSWNLINQTGVSFFENLLSGQLNRNGLTNGVLGLFK